MSEDTQFEDAEAYTYNFNKDKLTFKDIILLHLKKIGEFSSVEWHGGYWETRIKVIGEASLEERYYIPDSREIYSNAIEYLTDTLYPYFDKEMKKSFEEADKEISKTYKDYTIEIENNKRKFAKTKDRLNYRTDKREINRKLFRALCCFLYRKKYLELGSIED